MSRRQPVGVRHIGREEAGNDAPHPFGGLRPMHESPKGNESKDGYRLPCP